MPSRAQGLVPRPLPRLATPERPAARPDAAPAPRRQVDAFEHAVGGRNPRDVERLARATYDRHRRDPALQLSSRQDVARLIARSPQIDHVRGAESDGVRCGGASVLNAMLLDGGFEANGRAIGRMTAHHPGVRVSDEERSTIAAMRGGAMRPADAAHLQDLLYRLGRDTGEPGGAAGMSAPQVRALATELRGHGAFAGSEVDFHMRDLGISNHWTTSVTRRDGSTAFADSWPQSADPEVPRREWGEAVSGDGRLYSRPPYPTFDPMFVADVRLDANGVSETEYFPSAVTSAQQERIRGGSTETPGMVVESHYPLRAGQLRVGPPDRRPFRDPDTWQTQQTVPLSLLGTVRSSD